MSRQKSLEEVIICDPKIADGEPILRGTNVTAREILLRASEGLTRAEIARQFSIASNDVDAVFGYAAEILGGSDVWQSDTANLRDVACSVDYIEDMDLHKILVVDDLASNLKLAQLTFKGSEFTISLAQNAEAALQIVEKERPFLVLTDIQMPEISGLELCARLKTNEKTKNIAVIFITAHNLNPRQISEGLEMGADDYIARPFERLELLARVRAVARLKRAEIDARRQAHLVESRNRELELLNELALSVSSSGALQDILRASLQRLIDLLNVKTGALLLLDRIRPILQVNIAGRRGTFATIPVDFVPEGENVLLAIQEQAPAIVKNLHRELYPDVDVAQYVVKVIPVASRERISGALAVVYDRQHSLKASDWMLLNSAIGLLTIALDNAYLLQSVRQQVSDLRTLNDVGQALTSSLDQQQILGRTTQLVERSLRAEAASVWLLDEEQSVLKLVASSGPCSQLTAGAYLSLGQGIAGRVVERGKPYLSLNTNDDTSFFVCTDEVGDYVPGSILCVPLKLKGQTIGVLQVWHRQAWWFDQRSVYLLESVANVVVIAVDNARLFAEVQAFSRQLEQRVAERTRELLEEKERTEAILASMADGLLVLDAEQRVLTANVVAEQMLDFDLDVMRGEQIGPAQLEMPLWRRIDAMVIEGGRATHGDLVDIPDPARPGEVLTIQARSATILDDVQQVLGTVIVLRDITALKEVERMKARFMAGVTHELKTPLAVIQVNINNLMRYYGRLRRRKRKALLTATERQVKILERLVEGILELSRLDSGLAQMTRKPVNLVDLVDEVVMDLRPLAESKQVAIRWKDNTAPMLTVGDRTQLERVVRNLVDNAVKYTPSGGSVEVTLACEENMGRPSVVLDVMDTGIGISPEHQARVFERFYRVDPSHTIPGTGLGLSIVKEIVEVHGGDIQLHSVPGEGSTFSVVLPGVERGS